MTQEPDGGPIIEQGIAHVTHLDGVQDLTRKGRDPEKIVFARAVWAHLQRKMLVHGNRTVILS